MKDLPIASVLIVSLILATNAYFFAFSTSFNLPEASQTSHHSPASGRLAKFI